MLRLNLIKKITANLNLLSDNILSNLNRHIKYELRVKKDSELKAKNWYSKRHNSDSTKDLERWEMMTKKTLEKTKTSSNEFSNPIFDKVYRSRFGNINPFNDGYPLNMSEIYVSDFIMFNPNCVITIDLVDRILPYIKFKRISSNSYQIDRWLFEDKGFYIDGSNTPNYRIEYLDTDTSDMDYVNYDNDKWLIVRAMLQIMNETPNEYLNFNSYQVIGNWYHKYDSWLLYYSITRKLFDDNNDKQEQEQEQDKQIKSDDLIINLDKRLELDEIVKILYSGAKYGGDDLTKTNIKYDENNFNNIIDFVIHPFKKSLKSGDYIDKILDATINTKLDCNQIDLNEYLNANGVERTIYIINKINYNIKYKYNCDKIVKSDGKKITKIELLCAMYNVLHITGCRLEPDYAGKLLAENNDYIDYLYVKSIKTSFRRFPIINYEKYNKYNNHFHNDTFSKCIEILQQGHF